MGIIWNVNDVALSSNDQRRMMLLKIKKIKVKGCRVEE
jgi:hypothetical protein